MRRFSIFDCMTHERVSERDYATAEEANRDYHMNAGHTWIDVVPDTSSAHLGGRKMKHTPTPWRNEHRFICALKEKTVAEIPQGGIIHGKIDEANACFIVLAANYHDRLVEALVRR